MEQQHFFDLAISQIPYVGPRTVRQLISYCGSSEQVFKSKKRELLKIPGIGLGVIEKLRSKTVFQLAEQQQELLTKHKIKFHYYLHKDYPDRLKHFADAPVAFFFKGDTTFQHKRTLAIVGTRTPTAYGHKMVAKVIKELSSYDPCIISGLAHGIDTLAHKEAMVNELETIAILGQGLPDIYPKDNRKLAIRMMEKGGILSEFPMFKSADPRHFPQRNRIIAMLSDAILVVESKAKGGSMITANFGNEYFKDVFAIPGKCGDPKSMGCNLLIKSNKAALVESGEDIANACNWDVEHDLAQKQKQLFVQLDEKEQKIFEILADHEQLELDKLHYLSSFKIAELSSILLNLEFQGLIKSLPGKKYMPV